MYVDPNFKSKKELKEAVASGKEVYAYSPGLGTLRAPGQVGIEGPHYPQPHRWYARVELDADARVIKVLS